MIPGSKALDKIDKETKDLRENRKKFIEAANNVKFPDVLEYIVRATINLEEEIKNLRKDIIILRKEKIISEDKIAKINEDYYKLGEDYMKECGRNSKYIRRIGQLSDKCRTYESVITELRSRSLWNRIFNKPINIMTASKGERQLVEELQKPYKTVRNTEIAKRILGEELSTNNTEVLKEIEALEEKKGKSHGCPHS